MNAKRTAAIVFGGGALAAWLAGAATSNRVVRDPIVRPRPPIDARGVDLSNEIAKLHERLRPSSTPSAPGRNLFTFRQSAAPIVVAAPPPRPALSEARPAPVAPQPPIKLSGIAEDPGPDGLVRIAIISADGQIFLAKVGDQVTGRYRVEKIGDDAVELTDLTDNSTRRLALR